jgi:cellobiose-specific phosphotransferase system component IIB
LANRFINIFRHKSEFNIALVLSGVFLLPDAYCQTYRIDTLDGQTIQTCSGTFYDSGAGAGNYSDNENYTVTFYSTGKERITFDFSSFALRNEGGDTLKVYDGLDSSEPLLGTYTGEGFTFLVQSTDTCLTFVFTSDGSLTNSGWVATISCCPVPATSSITGSNSECVGSTGVAYSVVNTPGSTYDWIITGGTQSGGGTSNSITVDWGSVPGAARVGVAENNGCTVGDTVSLDVTLWSLPAVSFTGLDSVYDINLDGPVTLTGVPPGGTFSGNGITGDQFDPAAAGLGNHEIVYSYTDGNGCTNTDTNYASVRDYDDHDGALLLADIDNWCSTDAAYSNSSATADMAAGSCWTGGTGNNVWFRFIATTGSAKVDVITGGTYGTMRGQQIAIWNAANAEVACNNSADWFAGTLSLSIDTLTAGHYYWISVDDRRTHGTFTLCIDDTASYDFKSGAIELTDLSTWCSADAAYDNTYATPDESAGSCWTGGTGNNVWFKFTATTQAIKIDVLTGGSYGTMRGQQIALWNSEGTEVKCINAADWFAGTLSMSTDTLTAGHDYWISVDDRRTHGTFTLCIDDQVDYDYKSGAIELTDLSAWCSADAAYDNTYATPDESAGSCWTGGTGNNVWFRFTATTQAVKIDVMTGGSYGTMRGQQIALWNSVGTEVQCMNAADWFAGTLSLSTDTLTAGHDYWVSVDDRRTHGTFTLCMDDEVGYDYKSGAVEITSIDDYSSLDAEFDNVYATPDESAGSCWTGGTDNNVWFKFVASEPTVTISVITGGTKGTMRGQQIALWNASGQEINCANAADWFAGTLTCEIDTLTLGRTYYISVDDRRTHGTFTLEVDDEVGYDFKAGALLMLDVDNWCSADAAYNNVYATPDQAAGSCWTGGTDNNVWFKFVAISGEILIEVKTGGSYGTMRGQQIALWNEAGEEIGCINGADWYAGTLSLGIDTLTSGRTYYISVDDRRTHGTFTLCLNNKAGFDFKSGAILIPPLDEWCSSDAAYDNTYATPDESAGSCWTGGTDNNVWFKFVAPTNAVTIDVKTGGTYGTMRGQQIALWNENDTEVMCVNGADWYAGTLTLSIDTLTVNHTYYISVDDRRTHGTFSLCVDYEQNYDYQSGAYEITSISEWCSSDAQFDNTYASADESAGSCWTGGTNNNVWFKFTATTLSVNIDVITGGSYGTMRGQQIALWNSSGTEVACINGADWYAGTLSLSIDTLTPGHDYWISVDDRRTHGTFTLCVDDVVSNDYISGALELTDLVNWCSSDAAYDNTYATQDESPGSCWTGGTDNNLWYKFTANTGSIKVDVITGGTYGTMRGQQIAIWNEDETEVGCINGADWYAGTLTLSVDTLTVGHTYYISVDDRRTHGTFTLCVTNTPDYDYKSGAYELTDLNNWQSSDAQFSNAYATPDESAGSCWTGGTGNNVWFKFDALFDTVTIDVITGGAYGTMRGQQIALWTEDGTEAGCVNGADWYAGTLSLQVDTLTPGHTYYISVDDRRTHGTFTLGINNVSSDEYWSIAGTDWSNINTWSNTEGGPAGTTVPGPGNIVHIKGYDVTVTGAASCGSLDIDVANNNTSLTVDGATLTVNGNLSMTNSGNNYNGSVTLQNTGILAINNDFNITRAGGANTFSVTVNDNSSLSTGQDLNITSSAGTATQNQFVLNNSATLQTGGDINLTNTGGQKINIQLNNSAALTALNDINFSATAQGQIEVELNNTAVLNISGDFIRGSPAYGILDCNDNSTVVFSSSTHIQVIPENSGSGTDDFTFQNITVNNTKITSPQLSLEGPVAVPGLLTLTDGVVLTTSSNLLTLNSGASVSGGSSASYIEGPMAKAGNAAFSFPVGKNGTYKPVSISAPSNVTDVFMAEYFDENANPLYEINSIDVTIDHVSNCEYWVVDRTAGTSDVAVTIGWDASGCCITDLVQLKVVAWDGAQWDDLGNGGTTGDISAGTITSSSDITNNSNPVTFGDPFPIVDFSGLSGPYCKSESPVDLTGSPQDANGTFSGTGVSDNGDGTGSFSPSVAGDGIFTVTYTYLDPSSGCAGVDTQNVTVNKIPGATLSGSNTICEGSSTLLSAYFTSLAPWTFKYTNTEDTTEVNTSQNPYTFLVSDSGTYRIIEITDGNGCAGTNFGSSAIVDYYPEIPPPTIDTVGTTPFCDNDTLLLISSGGGLFSLWSNGETTDTINVTVSGNYYVNIVDANYCVSESSDTVSVTVYRVPRKPSAISGTTALCQNSPNTTYTTYSQYASSYIWEIFPVTAGIIGGTGTTGVVDWDAAFNGTAKIVVKGSNIDCGAGPPSDTLSVTVYTEPTPSLAGPEEVCEGSAGNVYTTDAGMNNYIWNVSAGGTVTAGGGVNDNTVTVTWNLSGGQTVDISYSDAIGCTATVPTVLNVSVYPLPVPGISGADTLCEGSTETYATDAGMSNYDWEVSAGGTITGGGDGNDFVTVRWDDIEAQTVSINYEDAYGCIPASATVLNIWVSKIPDTGPGYHIENEFNP